MNTIILSEERQRILQAYEKKCLLMIITLVNFLMEVLIQTMHTELKNRNLNSKGRNGIVLSCKTHSDNT